MIIAGVGRLGRDPVLSYTPQGKPQVQINLAVKCGFGEREQTMWCSLVDWGTRAELLHNTLAKGQRLDVVAEISGLRTYTKGDQSVGASLDGKILSFTFLERKEPEPEDEGSFQF